MVGNGEVRPLSAKVQAICEYPAPITKKELMRFLGLVGYYRSFCRNFSSVVAPLTDLLKAKVNLFGLLIVHWRLTMLNLYCVRLLSLRPLALTDLFHYRWMQAKLVQGLFSNRAMRRVWSALSVSFLASLTHTN